MLTDIVFLLKKKLYLTRWAANFYLYMIHSLHTSRATNLVKYEYHDTVSTLSQHHRNLYWVAQSTMMSLMWNPSHMYKIVLQWQMQQCGRII